MGVCKDHNEQLGAITDGEFLGQVCNYQLKILLHRLSQKYINENPTLQLCSTHMLASLSRYALTILRTVSGCLLRCAV